MQHRELEQLIKAVAEGDQRSFERLYAATAAALFGISMRLLRNPSDAEEVLQETFIKVWANSKMYKSNGYSPMTWLITIANNCAIDHIRLQKRHKKNDPFENHNEIADPFPGPEMSAITSSMMVQVDLCFVKLHERQAASIRSAYIDGSSYQELSDKYGIPINTIRTWLRRGLQSIRLGLEGL